MNHQLSKDIKFAPQSEAQGTDVSTIHINKLMRFGFAEGWPHDQHAHESIVIHAEQNDIIDMPDLDVSSLSTFAMNMSIAQTMRSVIRE